MDCNTNSSCSSLRCVFLFIAPLSKCWAILLAYWSVISSVRLSARHNFISDCYLSFLICNRGKAFFWYQNFISAQYLENKLIELHHILYKHVHVHVHVCIYISNSAAAVIVESDSLTVLADAMFVGDVSEMCRWQKCILIPGMTFDWPLSQRSRSKSSNSECMACSAIISHMFWLRWFI